MLITNHVHWRAGADDSDLRMDHTVGVSTVGYTVAGKLEVEWRLVGNDPGKSVDRTPGQTRPARHSCYRQGCLPTLPGTPNT